MTCQECEVGYIGYMTEDGGFVHEEFDARNPKHRALMEFFAHDCPDCRAALAKATDGLTRAERRRLARQAAKGRSAA